MQFFHKTIVIDETIFLLLMSLAHNAGFELSAKGGATNFASQCLLRDKKVREILSDGKDSFLEYTVRLDMGTTPQTGVFG